MLNTSATYLNLDINVAMGTYSELGKQGMKQLHFKVNITKDGQNAILGRKSISFIKIN